MKRQKIGITVGDMCGIGPEIVQKVVQEKELQKIAEFSVIGPDFFVNKLREYANPIGAGELKEQEVTPGKLNPRAGKAALDFVDKAIDLCLKNELAAMVTAPINKEAIHLAGVDFPGHTELLVHRTGAKKYAMAFYSDKLNVILTTIHVALNEVPKLLTKEKIIEKIELADEFMKGLGKKQPKIAVCGLNPHAGEGGAFGQEEVKIITPAIQEAQKKGINASGPYPPDTIFPRAVKGEFDIVLAHYHDQGLIPLKLLAFDSAINVTVGLPIIRTSVDHGTAFDIVGQNKADPSSLRAAIKLAVRLANNKR